MFIVITISFFLRRGSNVKLAVLTIYRNSASESWITEFPRLHERKDKYNEIIIGNNTNNHYHVKS